MMNILPINELRTLLAAVAKHGDQHLLEIEADLQQTAFLLNEAIEKLTTSFMAVHAQVKAQQSVIDEIKAAAGLTPALTEAICQMDKNISDEVGKIVTGMQFQDMTNQLLERTIKRVNGLKALLQELAAHEHPSAIQNEHIEIMTFLSTVNQKLDVGSQHLSGNLRKSVGQRDLSTGEIDLF